MWVWLLVAVQGDHGGWFGVCTATCGWFVFGRTHPIRPSIRPSIQPPIPNHRRRIASASPVPIAQTSAAAPSSFSLTFYPDFHPFYPLLYSIVSLLLVSLPRCPSPTAETRDRHRLGHDQ